MTDDTTEAHTIVQRSLALAVAETKNNMSAEPSRANEPGPTTIHQPPKVADGTATATWTQRSLMVDISSGLETQLTPGPVLTVDEKSTNWDNKSVYLYNQELIPINFFMGIPHADLLKAGIDKIFKPIISGDNLRYWQYYRPKSFKMEFNNFTLTVERDASGGVQLMDQPTFALIKYYYEPGSDSALKYGDTTEITLTDLNKGLTTKIDLACTGWIPNLDLIRQKTIDTNKKYRYVSLWDLIKGSNSKDYILKMIKPAFSWHIMPMNTPIIGNIKLYLNYTITLIGEWEVKGRLQHNLVIQPIPYHGEVISTKKPLSLGPKDAHIKGDSEDEEPAKKIKKTQDTLNKLIDKLTTSRYVSDINKI